MATARGQNRGASGPWAVYPPLQTVVVTAMAPSPYEVLLTAHQAGRGRDRHAGRQRPEDAYPLGHAIGGRRRAHQVFQGRLLRGFQPHDQGKLTTGHNVSSTDATAGAAQKQGRGKTVRGSTISDML